MGGGGKKVMIILAPAVAIFAAAITKDPTWNPERPWGSLRAGMHPETVKKPAGARDAAAAAGDGAGVAPTPGPEASAAKKPATDTASTQKPAAPDSGTPAQPEEPATPAVPVRESIKVRATGLAVHRSPSPIYTEARERLDVIVQPSGGAMIAGQFVDPLTTVSKVADSDLREGGLLLLMIDSKTPWSKVTGLMDAAWKAGWNHVSLGVCTPAERMYAQQVALPVPPAGEAEEKDIPLTTIKVLTTTGRVQGFELNGEACEDQDALETMIRDLHDNEYEPFVAGYSDDVAATPWILDGSEAQTSGVIQAMDALKTVGVKTWRLKGLGGK